jgi:sulfur carrier protein
LPSGRQAKTTEQMNITLNNEPLTLEGESITVEKLLELKKYTFRLRIVKINGRLLDRDSYGGEVINDGDSVQVIYLMSGG